MDRKTVLITGGNGFIGKRLTDALVKEGFEVKVLSRRSPKRAPANAAVQLVQGDYNDVASLKKALQGCQIVYHLAAAIFGFKLSDFETANVTATKNMVEAVNQTPGIEAFIHVSSLAASGYAPTPQMPRSEEMQPSPVSDYGITKLAGERAVSALHPTIKRVIIRPPIVYGKNDSGVSKIAAWVRRGVMVNTSGNGYFSFVHVDDLVWALVTALQNPYTDKQTYFISEPDVYTWTDFIRQMARAMGKNPPFMPNAPRWVLNAAAAIYQTAAKVGRFEPALNYDKVKEAVIPGHWICSSQKWRDLTGQSFTPLAEGLKKTF